MMPEAARLRYESDAPLTFEQLADEFGVSVRTAKRWAAADGGWTKLNGHEINQRAQAAADKIKDAVALADDGARAAATAELRIDAAVDERAVVLARHRTEWGVVRGLIGEAVRGRDSSKAKMAVDVARALDIAQRGESRAWGLDPGENRHPTVIIERC